MTYVLELYDLVDTRGLRVGIVGRVGGTHQSPSRSGGCQIFPSPDWAQHRVFIDCRNRIAASERMFICHVFRHLNIIVNQTSVMVEQTPIVRYFSHVQFPVAQLPATSEGLMYFYRRPSAMVAAMILDTNSSFYLADPSKETSRLQSTTEIFVRSGQVTETRLWSS